MPFLFLRAIALTALNLFLALQVAHADSCLSSSGTQNAEGLVTVRSTDAKAKPYILKLSKPVCLEAADAADNVKRCYGLHTSPAESTRRL